MVWFWIVDAGGSRSVQKKQDGLVEDPGFLERVVGAVLGGWGKQCGSPLW